MSNNSLPPVMLLRSFLTVGAGYVLSRMLFAMILMFLGYAFFPEFVEFQGLDQQTRDTIMENNPQTAIPTLMFFASVVLNSFACILTGWLVVRTAPFAQFSHAIFLAVLLFIDFFQLVIAHPPLQKSMTITYMIACPIAILAGAQLAIGRIQTNDTSSMPSNEDHDAD